MDTTLTLVVDWNEKKVFVDGIEAVLDDLNTSEINVSNILEIRNRLPCTVRLQSELEHKYIKEQIIALFNLWGKSSTFTVRTVSEVLNVNKHEASVVLHEALAYGVIIRTFNSAWRVQDKMIKESLLACVSNMTKSNKPVRNAEELLHENMERMKKDEENNNILAAVSEEEPLQITVGMKGIASQKTPVKKGPMKLSAIPVHNPEPSSLSLPKKKPVILPTEVTKKPRKSLKS